MTGFPPQPGEMTRSVDDPGDPLFDPAVADTLEGFLDAVTGDIPAGMELARLEVAVPVELRTGASDGRLSLRPPSQHIETSIMPVWHQLRFTVELDGDNGDEQAG